MRKDKRHDSAGADELLRLTEELERRNAALETQLREQDRNRAAMLHMLEELERERAQIEQGRREWVTALDAMPEPIFMHDVQMRVIRANRAYAARAGMDVREVIGRFYWELFPKLGAPLASCKRAVEERQSTEEKFRLPTGEEFVSRAYPVHDGEGRYLYSLHVIEDVTEKRKAEAEQRVLSEAMRQAAEAVLVLDAETRIAYLNPAFYRLFGYAPEEILGKPIMSLSVPGDDEALQPAAVVAALREHGQWKGEVRRRARDGTAIPVLLSASVIRDDKGEIAGYVGTFLDLREIKRAEQALAESEEKFRSISATALDAVLMLDDDGRIAYWNPAASRIFGYAAEEALGQEAHVFLAPRRYHDAYRKGWSAFSENGQGPVIGKTLTLEALRKDGTEFPIELSVSALKLNDRWHAVGILRDITARKQAEVALRRSNRALKAISAGNDVLIHAGNESGLLHDMCRVIVEQGAYRLAWVGYVEDNGTRGIHAVAHAGLGPGDLETLRVTWTDFERGCGPISRAIWEGRPQHAQDIRNDPEFAPWRQEAAKYGYASLLALPLKENGGGIFGTLNIYSAEANAFDEEETGLLAELADDLAFGILTLRARVAHERLQEEHLKTAERLKETLSDTIRAIALTVEKRDPYTAGHQNSVADLCVAIGRELNLPEDRIEGMRLAALIHDIGKIYVPAEILNRPGKLSAAEFEIIKSHPEVGYDIVKDVKFPWPVAETIRQHHEHLDGSGYPRGLKGEEIILEARILAVADTIEAMASHRPYRPAHGIEAGLAEIEHHRGAWYDPEAVDACLRLFRERGFRFG